MTLFLASVRSPDEARVALQCGADIVDVKEPEGGALGAARPDVLAAIVAAVAGAVLVSATIGDPPMDAAEVARGMGAVFGAGADIAKIGMPSGAGDFAAIAGQAARGRAVVAVLFADWPLDLALLETLRDAGAEGVMLDTADKRRGSLLTCLGLKALGDFVSAARAQELVCGLAGSLALTDVPAVLALEPDIIGFRGALCRGGVRNGAIDAKACRTVRAAIPREASLAARAGLRAPQLAPI